MLWGRDLFRGGVGGRGWGIGGCVVGGSCRILRRRGGLGGILRIGREYNLHCLQNSLFEVDFYPLKQVRSLPPQRVRVRVGGTIIPRFGYGGDECFDPLSICPRHTQRSAQSRSQRLYRPIINLQSVVRTHKRGGWGGYINNNISMSISALQEETIGTPDKISPGTLLLQHIKLLKGCVWSEKHALTEYLEGETHV